MTRRETPPGKILIPGVVSHAANLVEHSELITDRIIRFAELVWRENAIAALNATSAAASHPQIAWAKLRPAHRTPFPTLNFEP